MADGNKNKNPGRYIAVKKKVLYLTITGGVLGIIGNLLFFIFGSITSMLLHGIFQSIIPGLDLSMADAELQNIIFINAVTSSLLCIVSVTAGFFYNKGDKHEEEKNQEKYISAAVLIATSIGLAVTFSFFSLILIGIASIVALISVRDDFRNKLIPESDSFKRNIRVTVLISAVVLIIIFFVNKSYI